MTEKKTNDKPKRQLELNHIHRLWHNLNLSIRALEPGLKERWYKIALLAGFSLLAAVMVFPRPQPPTLITRWVKLLKGISKPPRIFWWKIRNPPPSGSRNNWTKAL